MPSSRQAVTCRTSAPYSASRVRAATTFGRRPKARVYTAILRHIVLVMAALAVCAVTAAQLRDRTDTQAPPPARPDAPPPDDPGLIPLTVREVKRLLAAALNRRTRPATPPAGSNGAAATRHNSAGSTNAHAYRATTPWSASNWMLPYQGPTHPARSPC